MTDPRFEAGEKFSDQDITEIESALGRKLPADYQKFVKHYGGAFVGGVVDGSEDLPVLGFFKAGKHDGIVDILNVYEDLRDDGVLPIARDELGNIYAQKPNEYIYYINYYGGTTSARKVANNFSDFLFRIVVIDDE